MPSAVRRKPNTIKMRVKLVIINISDGARTKSVSRITIFNVVTSWVGVLGGFMLKSTCGIGTLLILYWLSFGAALNISGISAIKNKKKYSNIRALRCNV